MIDSDVREYRRLVRAFHRATAGILGGSSCCGGLTFGQCHVLLELEEVQPSAPGVLARRLGLDKSTVTRTVDDLVRRGLVRRAVDSSDRRYAVLTLTASGKRRAARIHQANDAIIRETFDLIPDAMHGKILDSFRILVEATLRHDREGESEANRPCCTERTS